MEPMQPMKPMKPMESMKGIDPWWPSDLGDPATSGAQNGMRYAFFPDQRRLLIEQGGTRTTYDSGRHRISGVAQQDSGAQTLSFTSQDGVVDLDALRKLD